MNGFLKFTTLFLLSISTFGQLCKKRIVFAIPVGVKSILKQDRDNLIKSLQLAQDTSYKVSVIRYGILADNKTAQATNVEEFYSYYNQTEKDNYELNSKIWNTADIYKSIDAIFKTDKDVTKYVFISDQSWPLIVDLMKNVTSCEEVIVCDFAVPNYSQSTILSSNFATDRANHIQTYFERENLPVPNGSNYTLYKIKPINNINNSKGVFVSQTNKFFGKSTLVFEPFDINIPKGLLAKDAGIVNIYLSIYDSNKAPLLEEFELAKVENSSLVNSIGAGITHDLDLGTINIPTFTTEINKSSFENADSSLTLQIKISGTHNLNWTGNAATNNLILPVTLKTIPIFEIPVENENSSLFSNILWGVIFALILVLIFLYWNNTQKEKVVVIFEPTDTIEKIDYTAKGKQKLGYAILKSSREADLQIQIRLTAPIKSKLFKRSFAIKIESVNIPKGYSLSLNKTNITSKTNEKYNIGLAMPVEFYLGESQKMFIRVLQTGTENIETKPIFEINIVTTSDIEKLQNIENYSFTIGEEMSKSWIAFDAGTTGSCLVASNGGAEEFEIYKQNGNPIIDSVIAINKKQSKTINLANLEYEIGNDTRQYLTSSDYVTFQSIKKLLGHSDEKEIKLKNNSFKTNGKQLSEMLIGRLLENFREELKINDSKIANDNKLSSANRAVVAIPNHFVAKNTQDLVDCFKNLKFQDVRFVYEAEAVIYFCQGKKKININKPELILVFDMGGATINVTLTKVWKDESGIIFINNLEHFGYRIGGDSIDFCIVKALHTDTTSLRKMGISTDLGDVINRNKWSIVARNIKHKLIANKDSIDIDEFVEAFEEGFKNYSSINLINAENLSSIHSTFQKPYIINLENYVLKEISNIIKDITELVDGSIDKVILSGRSIQYSKIQDRIKESLALKKIPEANYITLQMEESKTAVAWGCCWYGIKNKKIRRSNPSVHANFGFGHIEDGIVGEVNFETIIKKGSQFPCKDEFELENTKIDASFDSTSGKVKFYQVNSNNPQQAFALSEKHKYSELGSISKDLDVAIIGMTIDENENVNAWLKMINNITLNLLGEDKVLTIKNTEIGKENNEHYTWMTN